MTTQREKQLARRLGKLAYQKARERIVAYTGKLNSDNSYTVADSSVRGNIWVAIDGNQGDVKSVINKKTGADRIARLKVYLDYNPVGQLEVVDIAPDQDFIDPSLLGHYSVPTQAGDLSQSTVPNANLKNLRVRVSSGLTVYIEAGYYYLGTTEYYWPGGSLDLTSSVPSGSGMKAPIIIGFDSTNSAVAYKGTEVVQSLPPVGSPYFSGADFVATRNAATTVVAALFGIGLLYGQVSITNQADFVDLRAEQVVGTLTSVTDATTAAVGGALLDQDVPTGTAHPTMLSYASRHADNGLASVDTDGMLSTMAVPIGQQTHGAVAQSAFWEDYGSNPLFGGVDSASAQEASVMVENGIFKMWYTHDTTTSPTTGTRHMNYATSVDGVTWSQYGSNPVLGGGGSGYSGFVVHSHVFKADGVYYCFFADDNNGNLMRSTSTDGVTWTTPVQVIASNAVAWSSGWNNSYIWEEGNVWNMLIEGYSTEFQITRATSTDKGLTWTFPTGAFLTTLRYSSGMYGGPWMMTPIQKRDGVYHLWYHASTAVGGLPTDIYHATSKDLNTWTTDGSPVFSRPSGSFDQVADPSIVEWKGKTYLYYERVNNASNRFEMCVAIADATIAQVLDGVAAITGTVSGVTASSPLASSGGTAPNITHLASGVSAATYAFPASVQVDAYGHVLAITAGTDPSTLAADHLHGLARWTGDGSTTTFELPDFAEYLELVFNGGSAVDPLNITLSDDRSQVTFSSAPTAANVLTATYVVARL